MGCAAKDAQWLKKILPVLGVNTDRILVCADNKAAVDAVRSLAPTQHTKHLEIAVSCMRQLFALGIVDFQLIAGQDNPADIFTKALSQPLFERLRDMLAIVPGPV